MPFMSSAAPLGYHPSPPGNIRAQGYTASAASPIKPCYGSEEEPQQPQQQRRTKDEVDYIYRLVYIAYNGMVQAGPAFNDSEPPRSVVAPPSTLTPEREGKEGVLV